MHAFALYAGHLGFAGTSGPRRKNIDVTRDSSVLLREDSFTTGLINGTQLFVNLTISLKLIIMVT